MKTVYKYQLVLHDKQVVALPKGAEILTIDVQNGTPCLWARVDTDNPPEDRRILIRGTGHPNVNGRFISTFMLGGGALVFHAFEDDNCEHPAISNS